MNMQDKSQFTLHSFQINLGGEDPVRIEAGMWKGVHHVGIRQLLRGGQDGRLYYGKQGYNIQVPFFIRGIVALLEAYNKATGAQLSLHSADEATEDLISDITEEVVGITNLPSDSFETTHVWSRQ